MFKENKTCASSPVLTWKDGAIPVARRYDDPYFSLYNGFEETQYVFLEGNRLEERFASLKEGQTFHIAELGFGTGLNFLSTMALWRNISNPSTKLIYSAFELYPMKKIDLEKSLSIWPQLQQMSKAFLSHWPDQFDLNQLYRLSFGTITLDLYIGEAKNMLPKLLQEQDAWYFDGFSPARNPELWQKSVFEMTYQRTKAQGTFSTYSAAGWVRENLAQAGYSVERVKGFAHKNHMTIGRKINSD